VNVVPSNAARFPSDDSAMPTMKSGQSERLHLNTTFAGPPFGSIARMKGRL
jgi:hypothetical protein